jgi:magnesium-transporting ATPase (P-type)
MLGRVPLSPPLAPIQAGAPALPLLSPDEVLARLQLSDTGLTDAEAALRLERDGPNALPEGSEHSWIRQLAGQFVHFFALMLWAAAGLALVGRMPELAAAIVVVILVNGAFSFLQEHRAERATRALAALLPRSTAVRRAGRTVSVAATDVVVGDLLLLREGDRIPADARVIHANTLRVDNSTMTGESLPVERDSDALGAPVDDLADATNVLLGGTHVVSGACVAVVIATGGATRLGGIARATGSLERRASPLSVEMDRSVRLIAALAVLAGTLFFCVSFALGMPVGDGFLISIGVIVALVPEGLLPTLTLALAMGASRMAKRGALVRHLEAVETIGATTVICTDKTGTLTANQMTASVVVTGRSHFTVSGIGYAPAGAFALNARPAGATDVQRLDPLMRVAALCGNARVEQRAAGYVCIGDPSEGALLVLARKAGFDWDEAGRAAPRLGEFPFDAVRRRMSTVHARADGGFDVFVKGSPESVLEVVSRVRDGDATHAMTAEERRDLLAGAETLAASGLRVLALAQRTTREPPASSAAAEVELELLGLVGLADPVRPDVSDALARCRAAGIRVVMVTGDHPATARSIAAQVGMDAGEVVIGADLPDDVGELAQLLARGVSVLARIAPEQKLKVAEAFQSLGEVVAMTGDGVNDGPALRRADIGIAMGMAGTDVAREAADLVLLDDAFPHIVEAIEEGRAAFENIRRFLTYHLTDNVAELAPFVVWALSGGSIPLVITVLQVLALDIGTDLLPALALGAERPQPHLMDGPSRGRTGRLLDRRVLGRAFGFLGPLEAAFSLALVPIGAALYLGWTPGDTLPQSGSELALLSTMVFAAIVCMQMANAFECRSTPASLFSIGPFSNRLLVGAVASEVLLLLAFVYVPWLSGPLGQRAIGVEWLPVLATPFLLLAAEELRKAVVRNRSRKGSYGAASLSADRGAP